MKIRHYSRRYLSEIRKRLMLIIEISHKNRQDSNDASSYELQAESRPHAKKFNLELAKDIRKKIAEQEKEIQKHKDWIEKKAPGFFKRISFVQQHVVT